MDKDCVAEFQSAAVIRNPLLQVIIAGLPRRFEQPNRTQKNPCRNTLQGLILRTGLDQTKN